MSNHKTAYFEAYIQKGLLDNLPRKIFINKEFIEFEDKNRVDSINSKLYWKDFDAIRYGYEGIRGYSFYIGVSRKIFLRSQSGYEIQIVIASIYNFKRKKRNQQFSEILQAIFKYFLNNYLLQLIKEIESGKVLSLSGVQVSKEKVLFRIRNKEVEIDFLVLNIASYNHYFHIYSEMDNYSTIRINYLEDWNSILLYSVLKYFLKNKIA